MKLKASGEGSKPLYTLMTRVLGFLLCYTALSAQSLSGWDHSIIEGRQDSLMVFFSKSFTDETEAGLMLNRRLGKNWILTTSCLLTDRGHEYVGATRSRPDLPFAFSSGRFLSGEIRYEGRLLRLRLGRLFPDYHPFKQISPYAAEYISGDGIDWSIGRGFWRFENRITFLKNEQIEKRAINRIFNFHALHLTFGDWTFGFGEFLIYTGDNRGLDWIWSNPFISYVVHNYDAYPGEGSSASEYGGDTDNSMFYFQAGKSGRVFSLMTRLYLDEFQVDEPDREKHTDELLSHTQLMFKPAGRGLVPETILLTASFATAAFGYHPGLFTTYYAGDYPLLPMQSGRVRYFSLTGFWQGKTWHLITDFWAGDYADIRSLPPQHRHKREYVSELECQTRSGIRIRWAYQPVRNTVIQFDSNFGSDYNLHTFSLVQYINF